MKTGCKMTITQILEIKLVVCFLFVGLAGLVP